jgi:hypothetical protein
MVGGERRPAAQLRGVGQRPTDATHGQTACGGVPALVLNADSRGGVPTYAAGGIDRMGNLDYRQESFPGLSMTCGEPVAPNSPPPLGRPLVPPPGRPVSMPARSNQASGFPGGACGRSIKRFPHAALRTAGTRRASLELQKHGVHLRDASAERNHA